MNRRADIGIGIELIESSDKAGQEIIPLKGCRTKLLAGGPEQIDHDGNGIGQDNILHHPGKTINVIQQCVQVHSNKIYEPEQIWDQKPFAEGNEIIQRTVHDCVMLHRVKPFHKEEQ